MADRIRGDILVRVEKNPLLKLRHTQILLAELEMNRAKYVIRLEELKRVEMKHLELTIVSMDEEIEELRTRLHAMAEQVNDGVVDVPFTEKQERQGGLLNG